MGAADNAVLPVARNQPSKRHCGQHISLVATHKVLVIKQVVVQNLGKKVFISISLR